MATNQCDVVVIGLGPGGEAAAARAGAGPGSTWSAIDERLVGGECPYYGCIPSKMIIRAADALAEGRRIDGLAGTADVRPDWTPVHARIRDEATDDWDDAVAVKRLEDAGARFVRGHGRLTGPRTVEVDGETFEASKGVVLNTGTRPATPPIDGLADTPFWTNRDILRIDTLPGVAGRHRRRPDRRRAGPGAGAVRRPGHRPRAGAAHPRPGRAGGRAPWSPRCSPARASRC